jgi:protein TonB
MGNVSTGSERNQITAAARGSAAPEYTFTFIESPGLFASLLKQVRELLREPKVTVPQQYYRGEAPLPVTEMRPWYRDIGEQLKALFEKPQPIQTTSQPVPVEDIWKDYQQQPASWLNSLLIHIVALTAIVLPYAIHRMVAAPAPAKNQVTDIVLDLPVTPPSPKQMGGGGGGGERNPLPASKGKIPEFSKQPLAPPLAKVENIIPKLPVPPKLAGPPELKLPQMALNAQWGDPNGVMGPLSNGPGTGGGIGSGNGNGVGPGNGGGFGPGEGGGYGGGAYSVGGGVTEPVAIYAPDPPYSEEARKAKYSGTVVLQIIVGPDGTVHDAQLVKRIGLGLDEKALETIRTWRFKPGMKNGVPVPVRMLVEVQFRLF